MRERKNSQSPYAKYGKIPHRYSENTRHWQELTKAHGVTDTEEHLKLNRAFRLTHGLPPMASETIAA